MEAVFYAYFSKQIFFISARNVNSLLTGKYRYKMLTVNEQTVTYQEETKLKDLNENNM